MKSKETEKLYDQGGCELKFQMKELKYSTKASVSYYGDRWSDDCRDVVVAKMQYCGNDDSKIKLMFRDSREKSFKVFHATASELSDLYCLLHGLAEHTNIFSVPEKLVETKSQVTIPIQNSDFI